MLKISCVGSSDQSPTLRLAGQVSGRWVEELRYSCERVFAQGGKLTLDLAEVSFVDMRGMALLRDLRTRQVALIRCSPFVAEQLRG